MNSVKLPVPTEAQECHVFVAYLRIKGIPFAHIANETGRNGRMQGVRNKRMGVSSGFPDYLCFPDNQIVAIEMKRQTGGVLSPHQKLWLKVLEDAGIPAYVCKGADEAIVVINEYLKEE